MLTIMKLWINQLMNHFLEDICLLFVMPTQKKNFEIFLYIILKIFQVLAMSLVNSKMVKIVYFDKYKRHSKLSSINEPGHTHYCTLMCDPRML